MSKPIVNSNFRRIADELRGMALEYSKGQLTEEQFVDALLVLDKSKLNPYGLTLAVSQTPDGWTAMVMKHSLTRKLYAAFEFQPDESRVRRFSRLSEYPRSTAAGVAPIAA